MLAKLTKPSDCSANLKAYSYNYGGISECEFNILSIFDKTLPQTTTGKQTLLTLAPNTPNKKFKSGPSSQLPPRTLTTSWKTQKKND